MHYIAEFSKPSESPEIGIAFSFSDGEPIQIPYGPNLLRFYMANGYDLVTGKWVDQAPTQP